MYEEFFGCSRRPFCATPDADCFIPLEGPQAALDALAVCCERGQGIGVLTGGPGLGKTLVGARLAFELQPTLETVFLSHSSFPTRRSLLQAILFELHRPYSRMAEQELRLELTTALKALRSERQALALILDEAHHLTESLLDELRLLVLQADRGEPLARLVLIGNPELEERLAAPGLASFNQRVCCQVELSPLTQAESVTYLRESLEWSGVSADEVFEPDALTFIARAADGVPRCLNQLADHTLLLAYVSEQHVITAKIAQQALEDLKQLPLMWHDPIHGGEIYRGQSQTHTIEDSAVDLWPVREGTLTRSESAEVDGDLAPLDHNSSAVEVGVVEFSGEHSVQALDPPANCASANDLSKASANTEPIDDLTCLRQDWAMSPPLEPHTTKWNDSSKSSSAEDQITGECDQPTFGRTFAARDVEFGAPSAESFQVEEFAAAQWPVDQTERSRCEAICEPTTWESPADNSAVWNLSGKPFDLLRDDVEFEEEPVIDRYVRHQTGQDSAGFVWDIASLSKKLSGSPTPLSMPDQADFSAILAESLHPESRPVVNESDREEESPDFVQDLHNQLKSAIRSDGKTIETVNHRDDNHGAPDADETLTADRNRTAAEVDEDSEAKTLGLSDHDLTAADDRLSWQLPNRLLEATQTEDDIESQIGADVLDLYLNARHALVDHNPPSGPPTISLDHPQSEDWADLRNSLNDHDEWSDEPATEFDVVQPEPVGATVPVADQAIMNAVTQPRKHDLVQRAYSRLFSELRAKQR